MKKKIKIIFIHIKSLVDFIFLIFFKYIFSFKRTTSQNFLFINTGNIGDLVITSLLFESEKYFIKEVDYYFLLNKKREELFKDYKGNIKFIGIDVNSFKYNFLYRSKIVIKLRKLKISHVYNLTSIRPTWNDILALTINSKKTYCYINSWKTLRKVCANYTDSLYSEKIAIDYFNEYNRINEVIKLVANNKTLNNASFTYVFNEKKIYKRFDIILAPFSYDGNRDLSIDLIKSIAKQFSKYNILILSSLRQKNKLRGLTCDNISISSGEYKLNQLYSVINRAKVFVSIDSGLTHIALKNNITNVIAIIGSGNYGRYLPKPNDKKTVYLFEKCEFVGCEWDCKKNKVYCIQDVSNNKVISEIRNVLAGYENT